MKKFKLPLLAQVIISILAGIFFGQFIPVSLARIFVTFNSLFGNFLTFIIPLIIIGLVTPAIAELGKGAGRLLLITAVIAYGSTLFSGFFTYFNCDFIFPRILPENTDLNSSWGTGDTLLTPFFSIDMPAAVPVMTALLLSFCIGLGLSLIKGNTLRQACFVSGI